MYSFDSHVRYSEIDETGQLSLLALIDYLQDCSMFQTIRLGVGPQHLRDVHLAWYIAAWQIEIESLPRLADPIVVSTWCYRVHGLFGCRDFTISDPEGNDYVRADSLWFMYDTERGQPVRPSEEEARPYLEDPTPRLPLPPTRRQIRVEGDGVATRPVIVGEQHLDTNHHMNNAQYVEVARASLPEPVDIAKLYVQYKNAAKLGDVIVPTVHEAEGGYTVDLADEDGGTYAVVRVVAR